MTEYSNSMQTANRMIWGGFSSSLGLMVLITLSKGSINVHGPWLLILMLPTIGAVGFEVVGLSRSGRLLLRRDAKRNLTNLGCGFIGVIGIAIFFAFLFLK